MRHLAEHNDCCGCSACVSICKQKAITFVVDSEGFKYPSVDDNKCIDCGLCELACPVLQREKNQDTGEPINYYAGRLKDDKILFNSSSGGVFSAIADWVFEQNGLVVGVGYDNDCVARHQIAYQKEDYESFRGSKYVQSELEGVFPKVKELLGNKQLVFFTGTPCQVEGLKCYLRKDYSNLITADIICHGVPSPLIFKEYKDFAESLLGHKVVAINMRDKSVRGWLEPFSYRFVFDSGKSMVDPKCISSWSYAFFSEYINRPSCHHCRFCNLHRPGDFTIADFWDYADNRPDIRDNRGTSLILVNTKKGIDILGGKLSAALDLYEITKEEALQPNLQRPTPELKNRNDFWQYYYKYGFEKSYKKYLSPHITIKTVIKKGLIMLLKILRLK